MKNKTNPKFVLILLAVALLSVSLAFAFEISDVKTENVSTKSAVVIFNTDIDSKGSIVFGEDEPITEIDETLEVGEDGRTNHKVILSNLDSDTNYYYKIKASVVPNVIEDDNDGFLYSFRFFNT